LPHAGPKVMSSISLSVTFESAEAGTCSVVDLASHELGSFDLIPGCPTVEGWESRRSMQLEWISTRHIAQR
jgi:hypothetical protein